MRLSIIIPTKDRGQIFHETLGNAVEATLHLDAEIIVVNDSKTSDLIVPSNFSSVIVLQNTKTGVASARNTGARKATGSILLFLDDDILINRTSVDQVIRLHEALPFSCFNPDWTYPPSLASELMKTSFGRFMKRKGLDHFKGWYNDTSWVDGNLFPSKSVASFHLSINRVDFERTGGYNEAFPFAGFEDHDFPQRLREVGIATYIDARVTVFHNGKDKLKVGNWLAAQERRAVTRRVAAEQGHAEVMLRYPWWKIVLFAAIRPFSAFDVKILGLIPNKKSMDAIYEFMIGVFLASRIHRGYTTVYAT